ncbi:MAG: efflux RND transporter periplasmic adaptor subunit [Burkholderiales bacterium]
MAFRVTVAAIFVSVLAACSQEQDRAAPAKSGPPATLITVAKAEVGKVEITEDTVGVLENLFDPRVGAEVPGRVQRMLAEPGMLFKRGDLLAEIDSSDQQIQGRSDEAEIARLETLLANQERIVERQAQLVKQNFLSQTALDDTTAQRNALQQQVAAARARFDANRNSLRKTQVLAPIDGRIEQRLVAQGDYVKLGDPMFRIVGTQQLRARLPFPESASTRIKVGMPVRISSPLAPGKVYQSRISELRPSITATSRSLDAIVVFANDGALVGGGSVNAAVVSAVKENVVTVPEQSVVLRPAGKVVYLVSEGKALQKIVETGSRKDGKIEIISGLSGGETIALDGAGFLTNNANVTLPGQRAGKGGGGKGGGGKGGGEKGSGEKAEKSGGAVDSGGGAKSDAATEPGGKQGARKGKSDNG